MMAWDGFLCWGSFQDTFCVVLCFALRRFLGGLLMFWMGCLVLFLSVTYVSGWMLEATF
jgi:hypothetical protein